MRIQDKFCNALDTQEPVRADVIVVLRNWDKELTRQRMSRGLELMLDGYGSFLVMAESDNTYDEAMKIRKFFAKITRSIIIVTHRDHHYRAFLTFAKVLPTVKVCSVPVASTKNDFEFQKIKEYQKKGDVESYEEGLRRLV